METTEWERYGTGRHPKCEDCMVHCGYEPSAVQDSMATVGNVVRVRAVALGLKGALMSVAERKDHLTLCLTEAVETPLARRDRLPPRCASSATRSPRWTSQRFRRRPAPRQDARRAHRGRGHDRRDAAAKEVNQRLAVAAARCGVGFALGSQRRMLQDPAVRDTYAVREAAPDLPLLFGNLGAGAAEPRRRPPRARRLVEDVGCDAFSFHLNALQEAIQPEGETRFGALLPKPAR